MYIRGPSTSAGNQEYEEDEGKCNKVKPEVCVIKAAQSRTDKIYSWIL